MHLRSELFMPKKNLKTTNFMSQKENGKTLSSSYSLKYATIKNYEIYISNTKISMLSWMNAVEILYNYASKE